MYDKTKIKEIIKKSHIRSEMYGIEKERIKSKKILNKQERDENIKNNKLLFDIAAPFIKKLYDFLSDSGFLIILTDKDGCILYMTGDKEVMSIAKKLDMILGAYMDEKSIGTNAMAVAIKENMPIQMSADDHFINAYRTWTCSAAPIHDIDGKIIGTLNLAGEHDKVHPHTLALAAAAVNSIEKELKNEKINEQLIEAYNYMNTVIDSMSYGILAISKNGIIKNLNATACKMLSIKEENFINKSVEDIINNWKSIMEKCENDRMFQYEDVIINVQNRKERFIESAYPIKNNKNELIGAVVTIKEIQRIYNLASKYSGMEAKYTFEDIIGEDKEFKRIIEFSKSISMIPSTILIQGESGTGKELLAQSIHNYSERRDRPFVAMNCGAIPKNLTESELFGYEEGSFTGARKGGRPGKFELANGGTLFLDEIGEMSLNMQVDLLRVLQERKLTRIGGTKCINVDVRIIAATNKDLKEQVKKGTFRSDLYYRISVIPIIIPPLRNRRCDAKLLLEYFLRMKSLKLNKKIPKIQKKLYLKLEEYSWPGNVRELENFAENLVSLEGATTFDLNDNMNKQKINMDIDSENKFICSFEELQKKAIKACISKFNGNITKIADVLGISRNTLYTKLEKYNIKII